MSNHDYRSEHFKGTLASLKLDYKSISAEIRALRADGTRIWASDLTPEARSIHLSYCFLRNRTYHQVEAASRKAVRFSSVDLRDCATPEEFQTWVQEGDTPLRAIRESALEALTERAA